MDAGKVLEKVGQFFPPVLPVVAPGDIEGRSVEEAVSFLNVAVEEVFWSKVQDLEAKAKVRLVLCKG